ncbi:MAG: hypothetical protein WBB28_25935 [Crinalium sp.]
MLEQTNVDVDLKDANTNCPQTTVYDEMSELSPGETAIIEEIEAHREYLETCGRW